MKQTFNRRFPRKYNNWNNNNWNKKSNIYSAGILPYGKDNKGNVYFLLGKDRQMSWSDFGGRVEVKDNVKSLRLASGGSCLDFQKALEFDEQLQIEKETLSTLEKSIGEVEKKIKEIKE